MGRVLPADQTVDSREGAVFILLGWGMHAVELVMKKECKDEYSGQLQEFLFLFERRGLHVKGSGMQQVHSF